MFPVPNSTSRSFGIVWVWCPLTGVSLTGVWGRTPERSDNLATLVQALDFWWWHCASASCSLFIASSSQLNFPSIQGHGICPIRLPEWPANDTCHRQWRIYTVKFWTRPPSPRGSKFFQFHAVFGKFWQNCMLAPPWKVGAPSWIRPILDPPLTGAYLRLCTVQCRRSLVGE